MTLAYLRLTGRPDGAGRAGRGVRQGAGAVARPGPRAGLLPGPGPGPVADGPVDRRAETAAGPHPAGAGAAGVPGALLGQYAPAAPPGRAGRKRRRVLPGLRPGRGHRRPGRRPAGHLRPGRRCPAAAAQPGPGHAGGRPGRRARPRRGGDRRDHLLHQHLQPRGDDRRRAAGQEGRRARAGAAGRG